MHLSQFDLHADTYWIKQKSMWKYEVNPEVEVHIQR